MFTIVAIKNMLSNILEKKVGFEKNNKENFSKKNEHDVLYTVILKKDKLEIYEELKLIKTLNIVENSDFKEAEKQVKLLRNEITIAFGLFIYRK